VSESASVGAVRRVESIEERSVPVSIMPLENSNAQRHLELLKYCLDNQKDLVTAALVSRTRGVWPGLKSAPERKAAFDELERAGLVKMLPKRGKVFYYTPVITTRRNIKDVLPHVMSDSLVDGLPECIIAEGLDKCDRGCHLHNLGIIHSHLEEELQTFQRRGAGAVAMSDRLKAQELERQVRKSTAHRACVDALRDLVQSSVKTMEEVVLSQEVPALKRVVKYDYKFDCLGRKYSTSAGAQRMSRRIRVEALPKGVTDLDIRNAMPTLIAAILPLLELTTALPSDVFTAWNDYAKEPERVREEVAKRTGMEAKSGLLRVAHGGSPQTTDNHELDSWLQQLSSAARVLRWLAVSQLPSLHEWAIARGKDWPENTTFAYFWHTIEDRVLTYMEKFVLEQTRPDHVSLHFDGLMCKGAVTQDDAFKTGMEQFVFDKTGLRVSLSFKTHLTWMEHVLARGDVHEAVHGLEGRDEEFWMQPCHSVPLYLHNRQNITVEHVGKVISLARL